MNDITSKIAGNRMAAWSRMATLVLGATAVMTLAAKVQIPFWPVPMTMHTMAVMAFAVAFGPRIATSIFLTYLAAGALGLPVFSGTPERGIGLAYMMGPTGGYLLGFLMGTPLVGWLAARKGMIGRFLAMLAGLAVVYAFGVAWLATFVPAGKVLAVGVLPFLLGDVVKIAIVAVAGMVIPASWGQWLTGKD